MIEIANEVAKAARAVAFEWPGVIDAEDLQQEVWVKLYESENYIKQISAMNGAQRHESLRRIGHQIASSYRASYARFSGNVHYGSEEVRKRLESGILKMRREDIGNGSETLTEFLDLNEGLAILREKNQGHVDALFAAYVGLEYDRSTSAKRKFLERARNNLTACMNTAHRRRHAAHEDGPGSRKAISNAHAHVLKTQDYSGGFLDRKAMN